eukprot:503415-Amphidinium_carterae.1
MRPNPRAIKFAAEELLLESTFAPEVKQYLYMLKVSLLSGRSTVVASFVYDNAAGIVQTCRSRLQIQGRGRDALVHGAEVIPAEAL